MQRSDAKRLDAPHKTRLFFQERMGGRLMAVFHRNKQFHSDGLRSVRPERKGGNLFGERRGEC